MHRPRKGSNPNTILKLYSAYKLQRRISEGLLCFQTKLTRLKPQADIKPTFIKSSCSPVVQTSAYRCGHNSTNAGAQILSFIHSRQLRVRYELHILTRLTGVLEKLPAHRGILLTSSALRSVINVTRHQNMNTVTTVPLRRMSPIRRA